METQLNNLIAQFSLENLSLFFRAASAKFRPLHVDFAHLLKEASPLDGLLQVGRIEYDEISHLIVAAGHSPRELSSQSGKWKQYEAAKKVLDRESADAGIFVFYDDEGHFRFSLIVTQYLGPKRKHTPYKRYTYFVSPEEAQRTFKEQMLGADFGSIAKLQEAFSVEKVTKDFFKEYEKIFRQAEAAITLAWDEEQKRLYTQRFFNRLIFLAFVERKGWLNFHGRRADYLRALFEDYWQNDDEKRPDANFHRKRLNALFFWGLNNARGTDESQLNGFKPLSRAIGDVPFLNGGLFEQEADDEAFFFPDSIVATILNDLIYRFNFTVAESTPLDVEVAVDPEMLGKIFEELVTGRHESGSYYTPKPVVSFMCKEALKGYLESALPREMPEDLAFFVDGMDAAALRDPELVLAALRGVRAVDPACGSGAYLLGLLHELLGLRAALFAARNLDARTVYDRKLEIIQNNLYGVDLDPFAVNIARLRLWLSLIVDFEGEGDPPPLPNLEFKIESGDSLTAPDPSGGLQPDLFRYGQVQEYFKLKGEFLSAHGERKIALRDDVRALREKISSWAHEGKVTGFDWQVEFAEVFAPELAKETLSGKMAGVVNAAGGQMEMTAAPKEGGFDIVLANPPYVRMELFKDIKPILRKVYAGVHTDRADLYIYFYARAHQILKDNGVACFISSNKWLRSGYGEKLRQLLLDNQNFRLVVDFGELPVFQTAATFPAIFLWKKHPRNNSPTTLATVEDLELCYQDGIRQHIDQIKYILPSTQFGKNMPRIMRPSLANRQDEMENKSTPLGEYVDGQICRGIVTGLNDAFILDENTRKYLTNKDINSIDLIKSLYAGDDIRHYELHFRNRYLIYSDHGIDIDAYPAIKEHLRAFQSKLEKRANKQQWYELQQPQAAYIPFFNSPKIIYPEIAKTTRFFMDKENFYPLKTIFFIPTNNWFLLGVLNSKLAWEYLKTTCSVLGNENKGGRLTLQKIYLEKLPIPDATSEEKEFIGNLAKETQTLHSQRRAKVEQFLLDIGTSPAASNSRNPLEKPWLLDVAEFEKRAKKYGTPDSVRFKLVRDESASLTAEIAKLEAEIDARVASLYGVG